MKRFFCFLIILIMLISVSAYADQHLEISCTIKGSYDDKTISADLYEQAGKIIAVSSLFPEYAVEITKEKQKTLSDVNMLCSVTPGQVHTIIETLKKTIKPWIELQFSGSSFGIYSGELFDSANILRSAHFSLSNITEYILNSTTQGETTDNRFISMLAEYIWHLFGDKNVMFSLQCYDEWRYVTVNISDDNHIIMTISADLSEDIVHLLIGYKEEGRNIYKRISLYDEETGIAIVSSYWTGKETSYQKISGQEPLFTEKISLSNRMKIYELDADSLKEPLIIYGTASNKESGESYMGIQARINGSEKEMINASVSFENLTRNVSFSDKKQIQLSNEQHCNLLSLSVLSNLQQLTAEIIPSLPAEYQKLLFKYLYQ